MPRLASRRTERRLARCSARRQPIAKGADMGKVILIVVIIVILAIIGFFSLIF